MVVNEDAAPSVINLHPSFTDVENYTFELSYSISAIGGTPGLLSSATIVGQQLNLSYVANASGLATVTIRATDERQRYVETTVQVHVVAVNDIPTATDDGYTVSEDGTLTANGIGPNPAGVLANDADVDGPGALTASLLTGPAHGSLTLNADGTFTYTPSANYHGTDSFSYRVEDGAGAVNFASVTLTVTAQNDAPTAAGDVFSVAEDSGATALDVRANDSTAPDTGETLAISGVTQGGHGSVVITGGGTGLTYQPAANYTGTDSFTYTVSDGNGGTATATVIVAVTPVNDDPTATNDNVTLPEDAGAVTVFVLANDSSAPDAGETLTITGKTNGANGTVAITGGGTGLTYTPSANFNGIDSFTYTISDGNGGTATATVSVTVTPVNDNPTAAADSATLAEDSGANAINVLANDSFAPDSGETLAIASKTNGAHGTVVITGGGTGLTYQPNADYFGADSFTYTLTDGNGGTATANVSVTVTAVNDNPSAAADSASVAEDSGANVINVLANDSTAPDTGETLAISGVTQGTRGSVAIVGGGTGLTYTPNANFNGTDSFTYTVSDGNGGTATATVIVAVTPVNDPPTAGDDSVSVVEDSGANPVAVLVNDGTAPDAGETLTITGKTNGANGTVAITGGGTGLTYTPATNFVGADSFTYTVSDGNGGTATATVSVTVTSSPFNAPPVAADDTASVAENGGPIAINVLANDTDADNDPRTILLVVGAAHGTAALNTNGTPGNPADDFITYTPAANYFGTDSFVYLLSDGKGGLDSATVTVTVTPAHAFFATGTDAGPVGRVRIYHAVTHAQTFSFVPYAGFTGGVRVAVADVTGDSVPDVITAPGVGLSGGALVKVYDGAALAGGVATVVASFRPYGATYTGEVFLAAGRFNGDTIADIVTGNAPVAGPTVKVFDGADLPGGDPVAELASFQPFGAAYKGGARVALGDVNGDGTTDVIAGMSKNGSKVMAFSGAGVATVLTSINVSPKVVLKKGVFVAAGNVDGDAKAEILVGLSNKSEVRVYKDASAIDTKATLLKKNAAVYATTFKGGVRVAALDVDNDGDAEVLIAPGAGAERRLRVLDGLSLALLDELFAEDATFTAGLFVAGGRL